MILLTVGAFSSGTAGCSRPPAPSAQTNAAQSDGAAPCSAFAPSAVAPSASAPSELRRDKLELQRDECPSLPAPAHDRQVVFDIPAQELSDALLEFARQAPAELLVPADAFAGATSNEVRGAFTPDEALGRLLRCTGFEGWLERGVVRLEPAGPVLGPPAPPPADGLATCSLRPCFPTAGEGAGGPAGGPRTDPDCGPPLIAARAIPSADA